MITVIVPLEPVAKGRPRFGQGRVFTPLKTRRYEKSIKHELRSYMLANGVKGPTKEPVIVRIKFSLKTPKRWVRLLPIVRPDLDNLIKAVTDACNGIVWRDDSQIVQIEASKSYDHESGWVGCTIQVVEC